MKLQRVVAISRKECIHIIRDWRSLFMAIAVPLFLLTLFGYALTLDVDRVPLIVWDRSNSPESRDFISRFDGSKYFSLKQSGTYNYEDLISAIDNRSAIMAMVIPHDFTKQIHSPSRAKVQLLIDGSDSNTATIALGYALGLTEQYSQEIQKEYLNSIGKAPEEAQTVLKTRIWYNPEKESTNNIVPGLVGVIMMVIAALLTSLTISREWEKGTMEQLISTPVKKIELIIGKQVPYFVIGILDVTCIIFVGDLMFDVPFKGSLLLLYAMAMIFLVGALSLGMVISIITKSQLVSTQMAMVLTFLPSFLLSGFMNSISNMPKPVQLVTYLVPARYLIYLLKAIYLKGVGLSHLIVEAVFLTAFAIGMFSLAYIKFKKKLV